MCGNDGWPLQACGSGTLERILIINSHDLCFDPVDIDLQRHSFDDLPAELHRIDLGLDIPRLTARCALNWLMRMIVEPPVFVQWSKERTYASMGLFVQNRHFLPNGLKEIMSWEPTAQPGTGI